MTTESREHRVSPAWTGWIAFGAIILFSVGMVDVIQGLTALFKEDVYLITDSGLLIATDFTVWGVALLIWGGVLILAAVGLFSGKGWARWFAIVTVVLNMTAQMAWFPAYPLWSMVAIGLGATVLFALTARWDDAKAGFRELS